MLKFTSEFGTNLVFFSWQEIAIAEMNNMLNPSLCLVFKKVQSIWVDSKVLILIKL